MENIHGMALCAGVAGIELGVGLVLPEYRSVCFVEREAYQAGILAQRMHNKILAPAPIWSDVRTFDGNPWRRKIHLITAGYPCQPYSVANNRRGADDSRVLWSSISRIIKEVQPALVLFENVAPHLDMGFRLIGEDLQCLGYICQVGLFSASEVGAPHRRERIFVLGYSNGTRLEGRSLLERICTSKSTAGTTGNKHLGVFPPRLNEMQAWRALPTDAPRPAICRLDDGLADRVDRIIAAGNGVVPAMAAKALTTLAKRLLDVKF
jgi:DNA (cytosine-5)-methyltransferase 1